MIKIKILKKAGGFVLYILLFVPVLFLSAFSFIDDVSVKQTTGNRVRLILENILPHKLIPRDGGIVDTLFHNTSFTGNSITDTVPFSFIKKDRNNNIRYLIRGTYWISDRGIHFLLSDSLLINYKNWLVSPGNYIIYAPNGIVVAGISLSRDSAKISLGSQQALPGSPIDIDIQNLDISDLAGLLKVDTLMASGLLNAKIILSDLTKAIPVVTGTASVRNLELVQQLVGDLLLNAQMTDENTIHVTLQLSGNGNEVNAGGNFFLNNDQQQFDALLYIKSLKAALLQGFSKGNMSGVSGSINGLIGLKGKLTQPEWEGEINFDSTKFSLARFGTTYKLDKQKISLSYPEINFTRFTIEDSLGNPLILNGSICSNSLSDYELGINLNSREFTLINTSRAVNNTVYGFAGINANLAVTGTSRKPAIAGDIYLAEKTDVTLVLPEKNNDKEAAKSVVRFIDRDTFVLPQPGIFKAVADSNINFAQYLNHKLNIRADKKAVLNIVIDPSTGDEIKVNGDARLNTGFDTAGNFLIAGNYLLDSGYYELNYQFLKKRFNLMQGSTIFFNGLPTDAQINIRAEYIANTSAKDLLGNEVGTVDPRIARSFNQKIPFRVILVLKGSLKKPIIGFNIQLPGAGDMDGQLRRTIENKLVQLRADIAATNKQVFALLVLGRFVGEQSTDFFKGNGGDFADIAGESVSQFLSAALDQVASDLFTGINVDLNLNSYKDFTISEGTQKTDLNVDVSKNFLNDRLSVTVGKNFGIESQDGSAKAAKQKGSRFLPDATVSYKLSANGNYMTRSYTKNQFELVLDGYVIEMGLGLIATLDYEKIKGLFIRKNKKAGQ